MDLNQKLLLYEKAIKKQINYFTATKTDEEIEAELLFCLLTPQSKAKVCWETVLKLKQNNLFDGTSEEIMPHIRSVRFYKTKSKHIEKAIDEFPAILEMVRTETDQKLMCEWLVKNVKGFGYKEASHFLRNIGFLDLAILDRHILRNLVKYKVIKKIPNLNKKNYLDIEEKMFKFSEKINIPHYELDLLFWAMQTGEVFK